jgi:uncharacterized protein DUF6894
MPRYHFHLYNSIGSVPDEDGRELPDLETARAEAVKGARAIIADEVLNGRLDLEARIEVKNEAGAVLFTLTFAEAVDGSR